jgi:hypothetical protein
LYNKIVLEIIMVESKDFVTGGVVGKNDFFFRQAFIENLWDSLRKEHVLIVAPRRMGKTSVMYRLKEEPAENTRVVFLNVEDLTSPAEFCQALIVEIHEQHPEYCRQILANTWNFLAGIFKKIEGVEIYKFKVLLRESDPDWDKHWKTKAEELIDSIRRVKDPLLIILDEFPDLILHIQEKSPKELDTFLHWFRKVRQDPEKDNLRWLIGGSVNLRSTLDRHGKLSLINDLRIEPLRSFNEKEVREFVESMLRMHKVPFQPEVMESVRELLGEPIPFFLQLLTQELYRDWRNHHQELTPRHVKDVFDRVLLGETARDKLQHFRSRITTHYPPDEKDAAFKLLDLLSRNDGPLSGDALLTAYRKIEGAKPRPKTGQQLKQAFEDLLLLLENDFYVEETGERQYDFANRLLKLWWRKHYG